ILAPFQGINIWVLRRFPAGTGHGPVRFVGEGDSMAKLDSPDLATLLAEYGRRSALRGGNPYRSKAYLRAAENLLALAEPLSRLVAEGRVTEIPGVGESIADIITKLH